MRSRIGVRLQTIPLRYSLAVALSTLALFFIASLIEVTVIFETPAIGDVSTELMALIEYSSLAIGLLSGSITIYNAMQDEQTDSGSGPTDSLVIDVGDVNAPVQISIGDLAHNQSPSESDDEQTSNEQVDSEEGAQEPVRNPNRD